MKVSPLLILTTILAGCAGQLTPLKTAPYEVPGTTLSSDQVESVRYAENIKSYPLGRYVDPSNSRIMHEGHSIYRVETTPKWNLHPNAPVSVSSGPITRIRDSAHRPSPVANELVAELNRQKEATKTVIRGGQVVSQKLSELTTTLEKSQQVVSQNAQMKEEIETTRKRMDALEEELRRRPTEITAEPITERMDETPVW